MDKARDEAEQVARLERQSADPQEKELWLAEEGSRASSPPSLMWGVGRGACWEPKGWSWKVERPGRMVFEWSQGLQSWVEERT